MKKKTIFISIFFLILMSNFVFGQGDISKENLEKIKKSYSKNDPYIKAVTNAVCKNSIKKLSKNHFSVGKYDHNFKYKVNVKGITNQESSGRCWMFTSMNTLRPKVIEKYNLSEFEFSTNYLYFYDQLEKSNLFLQGIIDNKDKDLDDKMVNWLLKSPIGDGGVWNLFTNLVKKYGIVPKSAMPETYTSENTSGMQKIIKKKLRESALTLRRMKSAKKEDLEMKKLEILGDIYKILAINLGEPPTEFSWNYKDKTGKISELKNYTPESFFKEVVNFNENDYVLLMDDPSREYYKLYEIEYDRNVYEGQNWIYINLPTKEIKEFAKKSIIDNEAMYFSCDVGKQLDSKEGLLSLDNYDYESLFGVKFEMDKKDRIITFQSGSSHGMALVGVDTDKNGKITKWLLENSWGSNSGHNGYLTMTDEWFDQYMFRVVLLKKFINEKTLKILKQKAIKLPPWDPMFSFDK